MIAPTKTSARIARDTCQEAEAGRIYDALKRAADAGMAALEGPGLHGRKLEATETYRREVGNVGIGLRRMDHPRYRAEGWLIGSGHVEAACGVVVGQRLKGNGMRWGEEGPRRSATRGHRSRASRASETPLGLARQSQ